LEKFRTHIVLYHRDSEVIKNLSFEDLPFEIQLRSEPTKTFWKSKDGKLHTHLGGAATDEKDIKKGQIPCDELIILADDEENAENILSIIRGGVLLGYPDLSRIPNNLYINDADKYTSDIYTDPAFKDNYSRVEFVGYGCSVLTKAYKFTDLCYAIEKYKVSLELNSMTPHSAHPKYGQMFEHYKTVKNYHTTAAFAINAAYSVIEELKLEIRSSAKNPRFTDKEKGIWNKEVLNDVNKRLDAIGIDENDTVEWVFRGKKTEVEKDLKPYFGHDSKWIMYGDDVRDKTLSFPEALHNISYLRNFIASHKFRKLTKFISPYDVYNTQNLARILLIKKLNLWQVDVYEGIDP